MSNDWDPLSGQPAVPEPPTTADVSNSSRRQQVLVGDLGDEFLRFDGGSTTTNHAQAQASYPMMFNPQPAGGGVLQITVVQARMAKNYGVSRMDPYCRIRVGRKVFETPTAYNGSKNPMWNKLVQCAVPENVRDFYLEIYDECTFKMDDRVAWSMISLTDELLKEEVTVDDWFPLNGKQGDEKEGVIHLILQYKKTSAMGTPMLGMMQQPQMMYQMPVMYGYAPQQAAMYGQTPVMYGQTPVMMPGGAVMAPGGAMMAPQMISGSAAQQFAVPPGSAVSPPAQPPPMEPAISASDLKALKDMFPDMADDIIREVLQSTGGNVDQAVNHLVAMTAT